VEVWMLKVLLFFFSLLLWWLRLVVMKGSVIPLGVVTAVNIAVPCHHVVVGFCSLLLLLSSSSMPRGDVGRWALQGVGGSQSGHPHARAGHARPRDCCRPSKSWGGGGDAVCVGSFLCIGGTRTARRGPSSARNPVVGKHESKARQLAG
jgi:hypothetical protein